MVTNKKKEWFLRCSSCIACLGILCCALLLCLNPGWGLAQEPTIPPSPETDMAEGMTFFQQGKFPQAAFRWDRAAKGYEEQGKKPEQAQALTYLAQALYQVGRYRQGMTAMEVALDLAKHSQNPFLVASILGRLGHTSFTVGEFDLAEHYLREGLTIARQSQHTALAASLLNDLGTVLATTKRSADALAAFTESVILADATNNPLLALTALLNAARVSIQEGETTDALDRLMLAAQREGELPDSYEKAQALINMGLAFQEFREQFPGSLTPGVEKAITALTNAAEIGERLDDRRTVAYAWGYLGRLYEQRNDWQNALAMTRKAIIAAQQANAPESLYQWEWQTARILRATNQRDKSVDAYRRAISTLQPIRNEVSAQLAVRGESFREKIGLLYFQLADLLLQQTDSANAGPTADKALREARDTVEMFKANELQDYFRDDCVATAQAGKTIIDEVDAHTAVIYPIMLPDRLELLVSMGRELQRFGVSVPRSTLTEEIRIFRKMLEKRTTREYLPHAQKIYSWLIQPLKSELTKKGISVLVFVPDGPMRTIPFAPLHDGQRFLIEQYALASTPGLRLTDPHPIDREHLRILAVGLTEESHGFSPLPYVKKELQDITNLYKGERLINQDFVVPALEKEMKENPFTMVHIASHGEFSNDPGKSFVLAFDGKVTMDQLDRLIGLYQFREQPLDLLTLSACETAAGNDQAALGLAGVAIKAGARSALATLWFINDQASSDLVEEFYRQLKEPSVSKAVAMQRAQIKLLNNPAYQHPGYWSPFLLLNNWL